VEGIEVEGMLFDQIENGCLLKVRDELIELGYIA